MLSCGKRCLRRLTTACFHVPQGYPDETIDLAREARAFIQGESSTILTATTAWLSANLWAAIPAEMAPPINTQPADELEQKAERVAALYSGGAKALDSAKFAFIRKNLTLARLECLDSISSYRRAVGAGGYDLGQLKATF